LAYLPFSKFFHIFSSPVSLMANEVMKPEEAEAVNAATRRAMELDACTHCAACSVRCSVGPVFDQISNPNILPSEKLISLKKMMKGEDLSDRELKVIREGACICTNCYQCTEVCPVGINLQDLWLNIREELSRRGYPELVAHVRDAAADLYHEGLQDKDEILRPDPGSQQHLAEASNPPGKFSACFECQTCTQVCPVVSHYENPGEVLHLMPHQIMHSLGLGLGDEVLGAGMVWDCVTCYLCQEHCPQGVDVADILYELRCAAFKQARARETA
jgi:heterodisulfide reductase subunit C